jgi:hypothetical protein
VRPLDPFEALVAVASAFEALGVRWYIGGSVASSARGLARASLDIDVVADLRPGQEVLFTATLRELFYVSEDAVREAIRDRGSFNVIHLPTGMKVDVFLPSGRTFDRQALDRAIPEPLDPDGVGPRYPVATAEDVIVAKLEWYQRGGRVSQRQWADVLGVLRTSGPSLDRPYLEATATSLGLSDLLRQVLAEA